MKICLVYELLNKPDEIILVNTGKADVEKIVANFNNAGIDIKIIHKPENRDLAENRNAGVKEASGDLIAFTDDDCTVSSNWIKIFQEEFSKGRL